MDMELHTFGRLSLRTGHGDVLPAAADTTIPLLLLAYLLVEGPEVERTRLATVFWGDDPTPYPRAVTTKLARWLYQRLLETYEDGEPVVPLALPDDLEIMNSEMSLEARVRERDVVEALKKFKERGYITSFAKDEGEIIVRLSSEHFRDASREEKPFLRNLRNHLATLREIQVEGQPIIQTTNRTVTVQHIASDLQALRRASADGDHNQVVALAAEGDFLEEFRNPNNVSRSKLDSRLFDWIDLQRARIAERVALSHLELAKRARVQNRTDAVRVHTQQVQGLLAQFRLHFVEAREIEQELMRLSSAPAPLLPPPSPPSRYVYTLSNRDGKLLGRDAALGRIMELVDRNEIVTLVGPPGSGKTELARAAIETARNAGERFGQAVLVDLEGLTSDPSRDQTVLLDLVGKALGTVADFAAIEAAVSGRQGKILVVLNNVEHFLGPQSAIEAFVLRLARIDRLVVLLTSREEMPSLDAQGARYNVSGLRVPEPDASFDDVEQARKAFPAIDLFLSRLEQLDRPARVGLKELDDIAAIVRGVQGIPLLIRLVAAQYGARSLREMRKELERGALAREAERILGTAWTLLSNETRTAYRKLAVFTGRFSREAALAVIGQDGIGLLEELRRKSLITREVTNDPRGGTRELYFLHPLLKAYARAQLEAHPDELDSAHRSFAQYFSSLIPRTAVDMSATENLDRIAADEENFLAFLELSVESGNYEDANRVIEPIQWHFYRSARYERGIATLKAAADRLDPGHADQSLTLGYLLCSRSWLEHWDDDFEDAQRCAEQGIELISAVNPNDRFILLGQTVLGANLYRMGRYDQSKVILEQVVEKSRAIKDRAWYLRNAMHLYWGLILVGDYERLQGLLLEAETFIKESNLKEHIFVAECLTIKGMLQMCLGNFEKGIATFEDGERISLKVEHTSQLLVQYFWHAFGLLLLIDRLRIDGQEAEIKVQLEKLHFLCEHIRSQTQFSKSGLSYAFSTTLLASAKIIEENYADAEALARESIRGCITSQNIACATYGLATVAMLRLIQLRITEGIQLAQHVIENPASPSIIVFMLRGTLERAIVEAQKLGSSLTALEKSKDEGSRMNFDDAVRAALEG